MANAKLETVWTLKRDSDGKWWFRSPKGERFWSFGVCCVNPGITWDKWNPENRGYAAYRLFETSRDWVSAVQNDLTSLGFNSIGGWSEIELFRKLGGEKRLPYFVVLHLGANNNAPWNDVFDEQMAKLIDAAAKAQIPGLAKDPYLIGYFTDNELGWWDDTLFLYYLKLPPTSPGRKKMLDVIEKHYGRSFKRLKQDWNVSAKSFAGLRRNPKMTLKTGGRGIEAAHKCVFAIAEQYYRIVNKAVKKYDSKRLVLGDRYIQFYTFDTVRASQNYVDAVSTNNGADWNDGTYARYFLDGLHKLSGKPVVIGEFYVGAIENRSGNKNSGDAFPKVQTQAERAQVFRKCAEHFAGRPYVVGAHWFQFYDEPEHGREDGEDWNMGLVDIKGKLYEELAAATRSIDTVKLHATAKELPVCTLIPRAPDNPGDGLKDWDRRNGFVPTSEGVAHGDLYLAQDSQAIYFGLYAIDYIDVGLYPNAKMPEEERPTFRIRIAGGPSFTARFGSNFSGTPTPATIEPKTLKLFEKPAFRHTVIVRVPKSLIKSGNAIQFQGEALTHSRGNRMAWKSEVRLR